MLYGPDPQNEYKGTKERLETDDKMIKKPLKGIYIYKSLNMLELSYREKKWGL